MPLNREKSIHPIHQMDHQHPLVSDMQQTASFFLQEACVSPAARKSHLSHLATCPAVGWQTLMSTSAVNSMIRHCKGKAPQRPIHNDIILPRVSIYFIWREKISRRSRATKLHSFPPSPHWKKWRQHTGPQAGVRNIRGRVVPRGAHTRPCSLVDWVPWKLTTMKRFGMRYEKSSS